MRNKCKSIINQTSIDYIKSDLQVNVKCSIEAVMIVVHVRRITAVDPLVLLCLHTGHSAKSD